jgi:ChrR-like protein with cupin domain
MKWNVASALLVGWSAVAAHAAIAAGPDHLITGVDQMKFGPVPPVLPPGAEMAVLSGDPSKKGHFVVAIRGPEGYKVPPHWHSTDEHVTVITGSFTMEMGDNSGAGNGTALTPGGYARMPARMHTGRPRAPRS